MSNRLALVVGHTRTSPGAMGVSPISASEYEFNRELALLVEKSGNSRGHQVATFFRDGVGIEGAYEQVAEWKADAVVELHFNAFNGEARGTETLYCNDNDQMKVLEKEFAELVQQHICQVFNRTDRTNRGIKSLSRSDRGYQNVTQLFDIPSILIEPFFGDNPTEAQMAVAKKQQLAEAIILAFEEWKVLFARERGLI